MRPVIYSGSGMWPRVMGTSTAFKDIALWDTNAGSATSLNPVSYVPDVLVPKPVGYGGWNAEGTMRIGIQQTFETVYNGVHIDLNSFDAAYLTVP